MKLNRAWAKGAAVTVGDLEQAVLAVGARNAARLDPVEALTRD